MLVFAGSSNKKLARKICEGSGLRLGKIELSRFDNDEARVRVIEREIGDECIVVQSLSEPTDHHLIELLLTCDALKRKGVKKIVGVVPWLGYSKQDKVFREGEPLSIRVIAKILQVAGLSKLITIDLHNPKIADYFKIPVVNLSAVEVLARQVKADKETVIVAPDKGAIKKSKELGKILDCPVAVISKQRDLVTGKVKILGIKGEVKNKKIVIIDDMIATGGTLIETADYLKKLEVQSIKVLVTHHLYIDKVQQKLDNSRIDQLVTTNSITQSEKSSKLKVVNIARLIKCALK